MAAELVRRMEHFRQLYRKYMGEEAPPSVAEAVQRLAAAYDVPFDEWLKREYTAGDICTWVEGRLKREVPLRRGTRKRRRHRQRAPAGASSQDEMAWPRGAKLVLTDSQVYFETTDESGEVESRPLRIKSDSNTRRMLESLMDRDGKANIAAFPEQAGKLPSEVIVGASGVYCSLVPIERGQ